MYIVSVFNPPVPVCNLDPKSINMLFSSARMGQFYSSEGFKKQHLVADTVMSVVNSSLEAKNKEECIELLDKLGESEDFRIIEMRNKDYGIYEEKTRIEITYLVCFKLYNR